MPAQSQQQQKLFGLALAVKRGEVPASEVSDEVKSIVDRMSEKDIEDFAGTSHKGLPKKVEAQLREMVREIMRERVIAEMEQSLEEGKKVFRVNPAIGKAKYSISSHDGVKKHKDGSDFFDIETFKNKVDLEKAIKNYTSKGFKMESVNEDTKKRFDVDFYKNSITNGTSHEEIIRGDKFSDVVSQATKVAKSKGMDYVEFYYKDAFIGSIAKKNNYTFKKGRYSDKSPLSVNEVASRTAMEIGGLTGMNKDAIQKFVDTNELDIEKVFQFVKKGKLSDRMDLVSAIAGKPGNPIQKKMIKMFK